VRIEGIIIRNSPNWAVCLRDSEGVEVVNVKQVSGRLNSDGINPVGSRKVRIADCFIRNRDDSIAVKTTDPDRPSEDILAERCVLWNDWGYALGVTYETRAAIRRVTFRDCDIIHGTFAAMGIHVVDAGTVSDIAFQDIRVDHAGERLFLLNIGKDMWATDKEPGHIRAIRFKNVACAGPGIPPSRVSGHDAAHRVEEVTFENLRIGGKTVTDPAGGRFQINEHTAGIVFVEGE
jgi:polygalacturonase